MKHKIYYSVSIISSKQIKSALDYYNDQIRYGWNFDAESFIDKFFPNGLPE